MHFIYSTNNAQCTRLQIESACPISRARRPLRSTHKNKYWFAISPRVFDAISVCKIIIIFSCKHAAKHSPYCRHRRRRWWHTWAVAQRVLLSFEAIFVYYHVYRGSWFYSSICIFRNRTRFVRVLSCRRDSFHVDRKNKQPIELTFPRFVAIVH